MRGNVTNLYRYPVKGLSADALTSVDVKPFEPLPFDRAWAIENGPGRFDPENPKHLPKICFLMLMRDERLASLKTTFDEASTSLTILRGGKSVATGNLSTRPGRQVLEQFFAAFMADSLRGPPRIVSAPGHTFSDTNSRCVHVINLASLREVQRATGRDIDPLRFRPNIVVEDEQPWAEFNCVGTEIRIGNAKLRITKRTDRCAATNVDPETGTRDMDIPATLAREWHHLDFGVYAEVLEPGTISVGATVNEA